ncbi:cytochrome c peroxidase/methylamine utilization protein MauG [Komagataeibacter xylinus NBRC 13693]|uniref:Cytochrome c peroxidase/methylamine utilization protein MauG n=2 Tax=Komagataeibacter xylinus TaxID=28448 RepID=A0A0D6Q6Y3_KOMXY|nr:cytochrome c peroxidase/methylamine utilization protein MauG [Komagataeibacter xylinus NBRC 13693]
MPSLTYRVMSRWACLLPILLVLLSMLLPDAGGRAGEIVALSRPQARARAQAMATLGRDMFHDPRLSSSGRMACASCHADGHAFAQANDRSVQAGGHRAVPSLKYLQDVPQFTEHFYDSEDEADESIDNGPTGGLTWDGRADTVQAQAGIPLLSPYEMANASRADVVRRVWAAGYGARLDALLPADSDTDARFAMVAEALATYQQDERLFYPYTSKYDAVLAGRARLSAQEARGLRLFEQEDKGNCASCHISAPGHDGTPPQFTDYGFIALGVPRNTHITLNRDPGYFDLGLCGPDRTDLRDHPEYCGLFRTPSLRNVATRRVFFHNGVMHSLRQAVAFYALRDTRPGMWYPTGADGRVRMYDDLPAQYHDNINMDPPFGPRPGNRPALSDAEIDDIVAFLRTLTDGYIQPDGRTP